jgi:hypothetical protein
MSALWAKADEASISFQVSGATGGITVVPQVHPVVRVSFTSFSIPALSMLVFIVVTPPVVGLVVLPVLVVSLSDGFTEADSFLQDAKLIATPIAKYTILFIISCFTTSLYPYPGDQLYNYNVLNMKYVIYDDFIALLLKRNK